MHVPQIKILNSEGSLGNFLFFFFFSMVLVILRNQVTALVMRAGISS